MTVTQIPVYIYIHVPFAYRDGRGDCTILMEKIRCRKIIEIMLYKNPIVRNEKSAGRLGELVTSQTYNSYNKNIIIIFDNILVKRVVILK